MDLFQQNNDSSSEPLASRMRPRTLEEYVGQEHILGEGRLLRRAIRADQLSSLIFYGPPGTGKTTLARVIANSTASRFVSMNAVLSGVKDLRVAIDEAREHQDLYSKRTILFVDEVHRWNKSQQDALLPWVEKGTVILVGATTENPYFEVNKALVSRSRVFQLTPLTPENLRNIVDQVLSDPVRGYGKWKVMLEPDALDHLVRVATGDARSLLNALQLAVETSPKVFPPPDGQEIPVSLNAAEESIQQKAVLYDKEGDYHFDTISAFIKSVRGSDPDAALYWMARMIKAGEDPRFIFRRMLISASEDIGMADPLALGMVESAASAYDRVGMPEGQFHMTQAALYLATAPKSNSALAFFDALDAVEKEDAQVPNHLKDGNRDKHSFGHGQGYKYPHAFREHWTAQQYLPGTLKGRIFYQPTGQGYEGEIQKDVLRRREEQLELMLQEPPEVLTYSPGEKERNRWIRRVMKGSTGREELLKELLSCIEVKRSDRILQLPLKWTGLFWELFRLVPEGGLTALTEREEQAQLVQFSLESLPESERPWLIPGKSGQMEWLQRCPMKNPRWEFILLETTPMALIEDLGKELVDLLAPDGILTAFLPLPGAGSRPSLLLKGKITEELSEKLAACEEDYYRDRIPLPEKKHVSEKYSLTLWKEVISLEKMVIDREWLSVWTEGERSWGSWMKSSLAEEEWALIEKKIKQIDLPDSILWERRWRVLQIQKKG